MNNNEKENLYDLLILSYKDVKNYDSDFANILLKAIQKFNEGYDYRLICTKIAPACNNYLLKNIEKTPKSIIKLTELVQKIDRTYRGVASLILNL